MICPNNPNSIEIMQKQFRNWLHQIQRGETEEKLYERNYPLHLLCFTQDINIYIDYMHSSIIQDFDL